jgi:hypothetical protein
MVSSTCQHGFAPGTCLICQTLATGSGGAPGPEPSKKSRRRARPSPSAAVSLSADRSSVHVLPAPRRSLPIGSRLLGAALMVVAVVVVLWWITIVAAVVFRVVELGAVTLVSGYVGWRLGVHHGRRTR